MAGARRSTIAASLAGVLEAGGGLRLTRAAAPVRSPAPRIPQVRCLARACSPALRIPLAGCLEAAGSRGPRRQSPALVGSSRPHRMSGLQEIHRPVERSPGRRSHARHPLRMRTTPTRWQGRDREARCGMTAWISAGLQSPERGSLVYGCIAGAPIQASAGLRHIAARFRT
jgi:hypothetical protein